jgi:hypothetical protein
VPVRFSRLRLLSISTLALAATALPVATAGSAPKQGKDFAMEVKSPVYAGVTDLAYTVKLTNNTGTQQLGSADVDVPPQLEIVGEPKIGTTDVLRTGNRLHLRNLAVAPTNSVTVQLGLRMPCTGSIESWKVVAKQSNDFSGTGNTLTLQRDGNVVDTALQGKCKLAFVDQPKSAEINETISKQAFVPGAGAVTVGALDARPTGAELTRSLAGASITVSSNPAGLLAATTNTATANAGGIATFGNLKIGTSDDYTLGAAAGTAYTGGTSDPFQIIDLVSDCAPGDCHAGPLGNQSKATLTGTPETGSGFALLSLNLGLDPLTGTGCSGYTPPSSEYFEFQLVGLDGDKQVVLEYTKEAMKRRSPASLEVCFAVPGPGSFTAKDGLTADSFDYDNDPLTGIDGKEGFADLLPNCGSPVVKPCVSDRSPTMGGGATITALAGPGDPRMH